MLLDNEKEYLTVWKLAHHWAGADSHQTDTSTISIDVKNIIHRLLQAIKEKRISAQTRRWFILLDDSISTSPLDFYHRVKLYQCLKRNKFNKPYLDCLYVKRNEVIDLCIKAYYDFPPCWSLEDFPVEQTVNSETKNHHADKSIDTKGNVIPEVGSSQQREAAYKMHEPREKLKQECIHYWMQYQNYSNNHVARNFYKQLSADKRKLFAETNAERTLAHAISEYRNRKELIEKGELPHWLINFNPEDPQL